MESVTPRIYLPPVLQGLLPDDIILAVAPGIHLLSVRMLTGVPQQLQMRRRLHAGCQRAVADSPQLVFQQQLRRIGGQFLHVRRRFGQLFVAGYDHPRILGHNGLPLLRHGRQLLIIDGKEREIQRHRHTGLMLRAEFLRQLVFQCEIIEITEHGEHTAGSKAEHHPHPGQQRPQPGPANPALFPDKPPHREHHQPERQPHKQQHLHEQRPVQPSPQH